ncbi:hypothetical protein ACFCZ1_02290 [Streptomyces sp. NPDC056224]|uniref:hypothetical protein n=1 Tax=Streptomyces sp. NPDC056224 TaxID=3345750 RepID=UPI0035E09FB9
MTRTARGAVQLYEITCLGSGSEPDVRTVGAAEVAAVIAHAGEHGMRMLVRPCTRPLRAPDNKKEPT